MKNKERFDEIRKYQIRKLENLIKEKGGPYSIILSFALQQLSDSYDRIVENLQFIDLISGYSAEYILSEKLKTMDFTQYISDENLL